MQQVKKSESLENSRSKTVTVRACRVTERLESRQSTQRQRSEQRSEIGASLFLSRSIRGELGRGGCRGLCGLRLGLFILGLRGRRRLRAATGEVDQAPLGAPPTWLGLGLGELQQGFGLGSWLGRGPGLGSGVGVGVGLGLGLPTVLE